MKHVFLVIFYVSYSVCGYVIVNEANAKNTADLLKDTSFKSNLKKYETFKTFTEAEREIYLEDVIFALKNLNWTLEEKPCLNQTLRVLQNLQNFTLWAVWNWDSISSEPQGLLYGNRYHLGNFDQCMESPWYDTQPELSHQYCLVDIELEKTDKSPKKLSDGLNDPYQSALDYIEHRSLALRPLNQFTWGICVPHSCNSQSVRRLLGVLLARSHLGAAGLRARIAIPEPCQSIDKPRQYDSLFYSFVIFTALSTAIVLVCTYLKCKLKDTEKETIRNKFLTAICLKTNSKNVLKAKRSGISMLYGLRFLSICFIAFDHQSGVIVGGPVNNGAQVDKIALSGLGVLMLHNDLYVDTFFFLSGFLSATTLSSCKKLPNVFVLILKRYVRLTVAFAIVIFYVCAVYPYTGSGPLWNRAVASETDQCRKNWWINLLMLNNYIDSENICIVISWYIPCDFHFFTVTILLYWLYRKFPRTGICCAVVIFICAIIVPGLVTYYYQLPPIQLFTYDFLSNPRSQKQFRLTYIKSHTRYAVYLIGFFSGLFYYYCNATNKMKGFFQKYSMLGAYIGLVGMFSVMLFGGTFLWRSFGLVGDSLYAIVDRPLFGCCIALLVLCCSMGRVPLIKDLMCWYPWVPLSRLSYGLYLTHFFIISRNVLSSRTSVHADIFFILTQAAGVIVLGSIAALFILLIFELPINNILDLFLKNKSNTKPKEEALETDNHESRQGNVNKGYMEENLPSPSNIISKF